MVVWQMAYQRLCIEGGLWMQTVSFLLVNSAIGLDNMREWLSELLCINMSANRRRITNDRNGICCCVRSQPGTEINVHVNYIVLRREMCMLHACYCIVGPPLPPHPPRGGGPAVHAHQSAREHQPPHCTKHNKRLIQVREFLLHWHGANRSTSGCNKLHQQLKLTSVSLLKSYR